MAWRNMGIHKHYFTLITPQMTFKKKKKDELYLNSRFSEAVYKDVL